jgi:Zn finger protein HypA/HybF involved in hydrogenase expression
MGINDEFWCVDCGESSTLHELNLDNICDDCEQQRELDLLDVG